MKILVTLYVGVFARNFILRKYHTPNYLKYASSIERHGWVFVNKLDESFVGCIQLKICPYWSKCIAFIILSLGRCVYADFNWNTNIKTWKQYKQNTKRKIYKKKKKGMCQGKEGVIRICSNRHSESQNKIQYFQ